MNRIHALHCTHNVHSLYTHKDDVDKHTINDLVNFNFFINASTTSCNMCDAFSVRHVLVHVYFIDALDVLSSRDTTRKEAGSRLTSYCTSLHAPLRPERILSRQRIIGSDPMLVLRSVP